MLHTKKGKALFTITLGAVYLILFFAHYLFSVSDVKDFVVELVSNIVYLLLSALTMLCVYLFHCNKEEGRGAYVDLLLFFAMRLFYQIPYYIIYYITDAYTTMDAILLGTLMGLVDMICLYAIFVILSFILSRFGALGERGALFIALSLPLYEFILLIIEIVLYLKQYGGMIFTEDITYFVFGFLSPALMFAAAYFSMLFLPKLINKPFSKGE